jgi:Tfp pilus assembly protein PilZ
MSKLKDQDLKGVVKKPFTINFIALIHVFAPIFLIAYSFTINGYRYLNPTHWNWLIGIENTFFIVISPVIAIGIFISHLVGWVLSLLFLIIVTISVSISFFFEPYSTFIFWEYVLFIVTNSFIIGTLVLKETRKSFFYPKLQWWKQDPRAQVSLQAIIENSQKKIEGQTHDISQSGLYLISEESVQLNEPFNLLLTLEESNIVEIEARVKWVNKGQKPSIPRGFGMNFLELNKSIRNELKRRIKTNRKENKSS